MRDYIRAEAFRKRKTQGRSINLPFTGHILLLKKDATLEDANDRCDRSAEVKETPPSVSIDVLTPVVPMNWGSDLEKHCIDVNSARKKLFPTTETAKFLDVNTKPNATEMPPH